MSFVIAFAPFLRVDLTDDATPIAAPVTAFRFAPTALTREVMANHDIVFRGGESGFALYYKTNPTLPTPLVSPIGSRVRFSFSMALGNPDFFDRHHPDFGVQGAQILLDNLDGVGAIQPGGGMTAGATVEAAELVAGGPALYPVRLDISGGAPAVLQAVDRFSAAVVGETPIVDPLAEPPVNPPPGATEIFASVDLTGAADAALRLIAPAPSTLDAPIYADDEIADSGVVGVVDLYWDQPQDAVPAMDGVVYSAAFRGR